MRSRRPANCGQYVSRPMPNTPTRARGPGRVAASAGWRSARVICDSEVELVDVVRVERGQRAEHDLSVRADRVLAQPPGLELLALGARDPAGHEGSGGLAREVPDVLRDPELELVDRAVL